MRKPTIAAIDLFCGAGGLAYGLRKAGISVIAGLDLDPACEFPFTRNNHAPFLERDVRLLKGSDLAELYPKDFTRLLAGCAPCQPFSPYSRGSDSRTHRDWGLLAEFARLVVELKPELVTMENVPGLGSKPIFRRFVASLERVGYDVKFRSVYCPPLGIPQHRRRLVLLASRIGEVRVPTGALQAEEFHTVREAIGTLPPLSSGESDREDRLHRARATSKLNLRRLRASVPGGSWKDWDKELRLPCHRKRTGSSYRNVYGRMNWDDPSPTITTQSFNFGTGRFGHPDQDRSITPREAAVLQTFPRRYRFVHPREPLYLARVSRLIGNAVPPQLGYHIGRELVRVAKKHAGRKAQL